MLSKEQTTRWRALVDELTSMRACGEHLSKHEAMYLSLDAERTALLAVVGAAREMRKGSSREREYGYLLHNESDVDALDAALAALAALDKEKPDADK